MIHSLSGGVIKDNEPVNFAKVKLIDNGQIAWFLSTHLPQLQVNDTVLVPYGTTSELCKAIVIRIDAQISPQVTPIPLKRAKPIHSIIR